MSNCRLQSVTPHGFRIGMKLEAVDKKHTALTCVATVADVLGDRILIHFDGWEDTYDYWCDPSSHYIHPMGWCQESWKPLSPPNGWSLMFPIISGSRSYVFVQGGVPDAARFALRHFSRSWLSRGSIQQAHVGS